MNVKNFDSVKDVLKNLNFKEMDSFASGEKNIANFTVPKYQIDKNTPNFQKYSHCACASCKTGSTPKFAFGS